MPETARNNRIQFHTFSNIISSFHTAFSRQFTAYVSASRSSISHSIRPQLITSLNQAIAITIPTLTNLLQLKNGSPFSTHPTTTRVAVSTTIIFYAANAALLRFPMRRRIAMIAGHCLLSIGNASVATLSSLLLPDSYGPFVFALFGSLSAAELLCWLYDELDDDDEFNVGRVRVSTFFDNVWTAFSSLTGQPQPILPP